MSDVKQWTRDQYGRMVAVEVDPKYIGADGRIIPLAERTAASDRARIEASVASSYARRVAESRLTDTQRQIATFENQQQQAAKRGDAAAVKQYGDALVDLRYQQQQVERREAFDSDPLVRNFTEQAGQLAKFGRTSYRYPGAEVDIEHAIATIEARHDYPDIKSFVASAGAALDKLRDDNLAHHRRIESEATVTAAKAEMDLASAKVETLKAQGANGA